MTEEKVTYLTSMMILTCMVKFKMAGHGLTGLTTVLIPPPLEVKTWNKLKQ